MPLSADPGSAGRALGLALMGCALGLALQSLLLSRTRPTGLWWVATALLPLHVGAAGGVLIELLRTAPPRTWPERCAWGRPTRAGVVRVLLTMPWLCASVGLVHWGAVALGQHAGLETVPSALLPALVGAHGGALVVALLALLVWVPLVEEVLFRFLLTDALAAAGVGHAGAWSAAVFAVAHGVPAYVPGLLLLGLILQHLRCRYDGLWAPLLAHAVYNAVSLAWWLLPARPG